MKALVVYESMFGNTETIARAIASGLGDAYDVTLADVTSMPYPAGVDLLIVGGPTHAFGLSRPGTRQDAVGLGRIRPGAAKIGLREYLDASPMLPGLAAAAFDTRVDMPFLPGSAARKAQRMLHRLGCRLLVPPASFRVAGTPGPLIEGEAKRATRWAVALAAELLTRTHRV